MMKKECLEDYIAAKYYEVKSKMKARGIAFDFKNLDEFFKFCVDNNFVKGDILQRKDTSKPYSVENCILSKRGFHYRNIYEGKNINEWAEEFGIRTDTLYSYKSSHRKSLADTVEYYKRIRKNGPPTKLPVYKTFIYIKRVTKAKGETLDWADVYDFLNWSLENGYEKGKLFYRKNYKLGFTKENSHWITPFKDKTDEERRQYYKDRYNKYIKRSK